MNTRIVIALLVAGALAFACAPRPSHSEAASLATAARAARETAVAVVPVHRARHPGTPAHVGATFAARVDAHVVHFDLDVANSGGHDTEISFPSGQTYDFVVVDSAGREVWRWADGRMFTQAVRNRMLGGGDTLKVREDWERASRAGRYTAIARLRSSNYPIEQRVDFVVR